MQGFIMEMTKRRVCEVANIIDLTGQIFGRLTVIEFSHTTKTNGAHWKCLCECGNETIVYSSLLRTKNTRSCGCLSKEMISSWNKQRAGSSRCG